MNTNSAQQLAHDWFTQQFAQDDLPPFSFLLGEESSSALLPGWTKTTSQRMLDDTRSEESISFSDPSSGLVVRCVVVRYADFPTLEWTVYFRNDGAHDTPMLADILAIDTVFQRKQATEFALHYHTGDNCSADSYQPHCALLAPATQMPFAPAGGRPTTGAFPYYNLAWDAGGVIFALGWPGQWATCFTRDSAEGLHMQGGQQLTHFTLHPGEEVRTPLVVLQFWQGDDWVGAQNVWRRWMLAHNTPHVDGQVPAPMLFTCIDGMFPGQVSNAADALNFIARYTADVIKPDWWWIDAGWYPTQSGDWTNIGTWEPDPERYPRGLRPISEAIHAQGMRFILWFEPERVTPGTWLYQQHPEWLLRDAASEHEGEGRLQSALLNLGNPAARAWLTDYIDAFISEQGIDLYRQDFNFDPLRFWRAHDTPDRQGITEINYVTGYLAYWDALRARHPGMLIDSCASGGRRNDLETLRRALPLLTSDYPIVAQRDPIGTGMQNFAISYWMPFHGTGLFQSDDYTMRSFMCAAFGYGEELGHLIYDPPALRRIIQEWRDSAENFLGDYYPLSDYSLAADVWVAWQYDRPEVGSGVLQVFRRPQSPSDSMRLKLSGLNPRANYRLYNYNDATVMRYQGDALLEEGLFITLPTCPGSVTISYEKE